MGALVWINRTLRKRNVRAGCRLQQPSYFEPTARRRTWRKAEQSWRAGVFWCTEAVVNDVIGVTKVGSGYYRSGTAQPSYKAVCGGEPACQAIRLNYDRTSFLRRDTRLFFAPRSTQLNRRATMSAPNNRSAIFAFVRAGGGGGRRSSGPGPTGRADRDDDRRLRMDGPRIIYQRLLAGEGQRNPIASPSSRPSEEAAQELRPPGESESPARPEGGAGRRPRLPAAGGRPRPPPRRAAGRKVCESRSRPGAEKASSRQAMNRATSGSRRSSSSPAGVSSPRPGGCARRAFLGPADLAAPRLVFEWRGRDEPASTGIRRRAGLPLFPICFQNGGPHDPPPSSRRCDAGNIRKRVCYED